MQVGSSGQHTHHLWRVNIYAGKNKPLDLPAAPGTYILLLSLEETALLPIGRRRSAHFEAGYYLYVGSALNGLQARLKRYLHEGRRFHWHIDWLLPSAHLLEIWYHVGPERLECVWATHLAASPHLQPTPFAFGASDCQCRTHLFYSPQRPSPALLGL